MFYVVFSNIKYAKVYNNIAAGFVFIELILCTTEIKNLKCQHTFSTIAGNMRSKKTGISPSTKTIQT